MAEPTRDFVSLIPTWVAATQNAVIPTRPDEEELQRCVVALRSRLREGTWEDLDLDLDADGQGLAVLSRLLFEFSSSPYVDDSTLSEAAVAHELASTQTWPADLFGERNEVMSQLALLAWRHSRQFGSIETMLSWEGRFRTAFSRPSAERDCLDQFLRAEMSEWSNELVAATLCDAPALFGLCELLRVYRETCPSKAASAASFFYGWMSERGRFALEGERAYILGTMAFFAGTSYRLAGDRESAATWLERVEPLLSTLRNADPELARLAYGRLSLCFEHRQFESVLRDVPSLLQRFKCYAMEEEEIKCLYVEAMALKEIASTQLALDKFLALERRLTESDPCSLLGGVLSAIGDLYSAEGLHREAMQTYQQALPLVLKSGRPTLIAGLKAVVGGTCRDMGHFEMAADLYREAISDYSELAIGSLAAYMRIVLAETLLLAGRPLEAEIEILAAIPTIEKERMVEEGFAALKLLRESVNRSETDVASLRALRERIKRA